jgi:hypothetical protein
MDFEEYVQASKGSLEDQGALAHSLLVNAFSKFTFFPQKYWFDTYRTLCFMHATGITNASDSSCNSDGGGVKGHKTPSASEKSYASMCQQMPLYNPDGDILLHVTIQYGADNMCAMRSFRMSLAQTKKDLQKDGDTLITTNTTTVSTNNKNDNKNTTDGATTPVDTTTNNGISKDVSITNTSPPTSPFSFNPSAISELLQRFCSDNFHASTNESEKKQKEEQEEKKGDEKDEKQSIRQMLQSKCCVSCQSTDLSANISCHGCGYRYCSESCKQENATFHTVACSVLQESAPFVSSILSFLDGSGGDAK